MKPVPAVPVPPTTLGAEARRGARVGQVCGSGAAGNPRACSVRPPSVLSWGGTSWERAGMEVLGCEQHMWPPRNVTMGFSGKTATSHQLHPLGSSDGIPGRQGDAEAYPLRTCPILGLRKGGLSHAPSSAEPHGGCFCLAFCSVTHQHGHYSGVPCLGVPSDGSPAPAALLARGSHRNASRLLPGSCPVPLGTGRMTAELVRRRCGISHNCRHFDVRNLLPEGYSLPAANLRLASGC